MRINEAHKADVKIGIQCNKCLKTSFTDLLKECQHHARG